jgi:hypothetical protein
MVLGMRVESVRRLLLLFYVSLLVGWGRCLASTFSFMFELRWGFVGFDFRWLLGWGWVHMHGWFLVCSWVFWYGRFVYFEASGLL